MVAIHFPNRAPFIAAHAVVDDFGTELQLSALDLFATAVAFIMSDREH